MSVLTKLFVILMIVCALLLTGGVVVFVNRVEDYKTANAALEQARLSVEAQRDAAQNAERAAQDREKEQARQLNSKIAELNGEIQKAAQALAGAGAEKIQLNNQIATMTAQGTALTQGLAAANQNLKDIQTRYDALVKSNDQLLNRNTELVATNTDLQKRLEEADRERRWLNERVVQLKSDLDRAARVLTENHLTMDSATVATRPPVGVSGVVKAVKAQDGLHFATISLGSADRIAKGMKFLVYNAGSQKLLAILTIEAVDLNEAFGRLEGEAVADVSKESTVIPQ